MLADGRRNQRRVVVARAQIARATQRAHDLRTDHPLAGIRSLVAERLPIDVELDDLEHEQRHEAPIAARHRKITPQHFLEVREAHEPGAGIDAIHRCDLLSRATELALQQRELAARVGRRARLGLGDARNGLMAQHEVAELAARAAQRRHADRARPRGTVLAQLGNRHAARLAATDGRLQRFEPRVAAGGSREHGPRPPAELPQRVARQTLVSGIGIDDRQLGIVRIGNENRGRNGGNDLL